MKKYYTASDLASLSKLSRQTIVRYEKIGVIEPSARLGLNETPIYDETAIEAIRDRLIDEKNQNYNLPKTVDELADLLRK